MPRIIFIFSMLVFSTYANAISCKDVRQGVFKMHTLYGALNTIVRTNDKQMETYGRTGLVVEYDIRWTADCSYMLFNQRIIRGRDSLLTTIESDTIFNEITEINTSWNKISSSVNGSEQKTLISYFPVDTVNTYKDLKDVGVFKDYDRSSRGTLAGYNFAIVYKQNTEDPGKYVITFLEALQINDRSKYRLIDYLYCSIDTNQRLTASGCRFDGEFDKEIVAAYISLDPKKEAFIFRAWRCNKSRLKIEEIPIDRVKFKESDSWKIVW